MNRAEARYWDLPSALLLILALTVVSQRLVATGWTTDLGLTFILAFTGILLGFPLGLSSFRRAAMILLATLYGLVIVPFLLAAFIYAGVPWLERMSSMGGRLAYSLGVIASGAPLEDTFIFVLIFCISFWVLGVASASALTRRASFPAAALPGGAVMLILQILDQAGDRSLIFFALYFFLALLLLGRMHYARRKESWQTWRLFAAGEARANINLTILAFALLLVLAAWLIPVSPRNVPILHEWWQEFSKPWRDNENISNIIAGLETEPEIVVNEFYSRTLVLGSFAPLNESIYFRIQTSGVGNLERYYWRVRSYDLYSNGLWETSTAYERSLNSRTRSLQLPESTGLNAEYTFKVLNTTAGLLVTPARPTWISRPTRLTFFPVDEDVVEPLLFRPVEPIQSGEEYIMHAILLEPTVKQLRLAGTDYPDWVSERYLQLPQDLPPAIRDLAFEITEDAETPYDQALAVTNWLRAEIKYSTRFIPAPAGRDSLAWFLFDYKQGFCNYYATAEVVMLRAVGIPARMVVGFSQGEYESPGWYNVRQRNAHAWPEVYFPGIGWVEFEPTSSEVELIRPSGEEPVLSSTRTPGASPSLNTVIPPDFQENNPDLVPGGNGSPGGARDSLTMLLVFTLIIILVTAGVAWAYISGALEKGYRAVRSTFNAPAPILARNWLEKNALPVPVWLQHRAWLAGLTPVTRSFMSIYNALRLLKVPHHTTATPLEAAAALMGAIPQADTEIAVLLEEYLPCIYYTTPPGQERARSAAHSLRRKARKARRQRWFRLRHKPSAHGEL